MSRDWRSHSDEPGPIRVKGMVADQALTLALVKTRSSGYTYNWPGLKKFFKGGKVLSLFSVTEKETCDNTDFHLWLLPTSVEDRRILASVVVPTSLCHDLSSRDYFKTRWVSWDFRSHRNPLDNILFITK